jgi:hypothetical protein
LTGIDKWDAELPQRWRETLARAERAEAALAEAQRERDELRKLTAECICYDGNPANYEGARPDCMVHGSIRAFHEASADLAAALEQRDDARAEVERMREERDEARQQATAWYETARRQGEARDAMYPVVEKVRPALNAITHCVGCSGGPEYAATAYGCAVDDSEIRALRAAVDTYESQESTDGR